MHLLLEKLHRDQMNGSWVKIGEPMVDGEEAIPQVIFVNFRSAVNFEANFEIM